MAGRDNSKNKIPALSSDVKMKKRGRPPGSKSNRGRGRSPSPSPSGFRGCSPSPGPSGFRGCSPSPSPSGVPPNTVSNVETGTDLVAYPITVNIGEDLVDKVSRIAKRSSQTVCILSAVGSISSVVFRKPGLPSTDTVTWEGCFDILSLSGNYSFVPGQENGHGGHNYCNLTISDCRGTVFGGSVVGPMIVASPVYLTLGTFKLGSAGKTTVPAFATAPVTSGPLLIPKTEYQELESLTTPKTADKTSECDITPKTADKTSESVTTPKTTDKPTENVTSTSRDGEDPNGEGEKQSVTPKITDKPQEELSSETVDKPPENVTPSTSDKPPEDVTPAISDKPPEDVTPATSDKPPQDVTPATSDIPS
ncbi:AT-hook motif nuclear-localized protein 2-like [Vigna umbellata]|uniref:AT-hook motif nuclear-localized protein 2-like n=1 Tax=Vigna umbellata TaxID=87088 RepID=UPI001F5EDB4B|nr:AT-hook motif nuclear-localized protein 2-like [Vigna umbellata]